MNTRLQIRKHDPFISFRYRAVNCFFFNFGHFSMTPSGKILQCKKLFLHAYDYELDQTTKQKFGEDRLAGSRDTTPKLCLALSLLVAGWKIFCYYFRTFW